MPLYIYDHTIKCTCCNFEAKVTQQGAFDIDGTIEPKCPLCGRPNLVNDWQEQLDLQKRLNEQEGSK